MKNLIELEYENEIWLFLEMVTYRVLSLRREFVNKKITTINSKPIDKVKIKINFLTNDFEYNSSDEFHKLINSLNHFVRLSYARINLMDEKYETIGMLIYDKDVKFDKDVEILAGENESKDFRIQQEWGGSKWKGTIGKLHSLKSIQTFSYFEETGKFGIKCLFEVKSSI